MLIGHPQIPGNVLDDGNHSPGRNAAHRNKAAVLQVADAMSGGDQDSAILILKKGIRNVVQPRADTIGFNLPVNPSVQAARSAEPDASIPRGQNGSNATIGQTLLSSQRGDSKLAKSVETVCGSYPNIAFAVFKERLTTNIIVREAVSRSEHICPCLVYTNKALCLCSNPQAAIAVAEYPVGPELPRSTREWIHLGFSVNKPVDSTLPSHQEC